MKRRADRKIANRPAFAALVRSMLGAIALGCGLLLSAESASACEAGSACSQLDELLAAETQAETLPQNRPEKHSGTGVRITVEDDEIARVNTQGLLDSVDIQVKFDGLEITRELNVTVLPERRLVSPGETLQFRGAWNYGPWISRAELRLFRAAEKVSALSAAVPVAVVPLDEDGRAEWNPAEAGFDEGEIAYSLRVYDPQGRFDETAPLVLKISDRAEDFQKPGSTGVIEGEDRTLFANIPLQGGKVTVYGREIPPGYAVYVMGQPVPVDGTGAFAASRIVPTGDHHVAVAVVPTSAGQKGLEFEREITVPDHELFYVGIIDATFGKRLGSESDLLHPAAPGEFDAVYNRGRVAFYLKGKVKGEYLITAAMDTREDELDELFTDFDRKDPRALLRRLDPDDYYPIYGDDSTTVEDAPTSGKFYVRIDKGQNHVMWGNFKVGFDGMELSRFDRAMYGAKAELRSEAVTSRGETAGAVTAFAAQPGTLPQRDEFRGTGGSAYFLTHQDITTGSERLSIEERDRVSGQVVGRRNLVYGDDYDFDYFQGVVLLRSPLPASTFDGGAVKDSALGGNENWLVITYEYTPAAGETDAYSYGGRAHAWLNDNLRVGVTGLQERISGNERTLLGADVVLRGGKNSVTEVEWAQSSGAGSPFASSTDGGFLFNQPMIAGEANAWRAKTSIALADLTGIDMPGSFGGYFEKYEAGFSSSSKYKEFDEQLWGVFADFGYVDLGSGGGVGLKARFDKLQRGDGLEKSEGTAEATIRFDERWSAQIAGTHSQVAGNTGADGNGRRTDAGVKLIYEFDDSHKAWIFGQATLDRSPSRQRNDRAGVGFEADLTDKTTALAEVSYGTSGIGAQATLGYEPTAGDKYYIGYRLEPDSSLSDWTGYDPLRSDYGSLVYGATRKFSDAFSVHAEESRDMTGEQRSLLRTYGVDFTPAPEWKLSAGVEAGRISDNVNGDFERTAVSGGIAHKAEGYQSSLRLEAGFEDSLNNAARDRDTFLASGKMAISVSPDWRFLARADAVISQSNEDAVLDGDYVEASAGFAYRPVEHDRFNALFKYTFLYDLPGPQQVNYQGVVAGPKQRSHILTADFIADVNEYLSVGGKYGFRTGEVSMTRDDHDFYRSTAHLGVVRSDLHIVHQWDVMLEGRALWVEELEQVQFGALAGLYRHVGDNVKIGVGYNFGRFSDDLSDLTWDDKGVFINVIGKF